MDKSAIDEEPSNEEIDNRLKLLDLPNKILTRIFTHLGNNDRLRARVCRKIVGIEKNMVPENPLREIESIDIEVDSSYVTFVATKGPNRWMYMHKYSYKSALLLLKRLIQTFRFQRICIKVWCNSHFNLLLFFLVSNVKVTSLFRIAKAEYIETNFYYAQLRSLLTNNELDKVHIECVLLINATELKELRQITLDRPTIGSILLEDVEHSILKEFASSEMGIDPEISSVLIRAKSRVQLPGGRKGTV
ncbi:hypothetical protein PFISCL1PPCAC_3907, partial [Pristionchus fissidentatus]